MPGQLSDLLSAINNPEGYIYNRVKRGEMDAETRLRENLFASGYEGERQPSGITEPRGILGSIGESIGILGPNPQRPLTEYERMLLSQGRTTREESDLDLEGKKLNLSEAKKGAMLNALIRGQKAYGISNVASPEFVEGQPDLQDDYGGMIRVSDRREKERLEDNALKDMETLARIRYANAGVAGTRGGVDPDEVAKVKGVKQAKDILNSPINVALKRQFDFFFGDETTGQVGAFEKARRSGDPFERSKLIEGDQYGGGYRRLYQQLYDAFRAGGIRADIIPQILEVPPDPNEAMRPFGSPYADQPAAAAGMQGVADAEWEKLDRAVPAEAPGAPYTLGGERRSVPWNRPAPTGRPK